MPSPLPRSLLLALSIAAASLHPAAADPAGRVHDRAIVLDTHFDTPMKFHLDGWNIMDRHDVEGDASQVDYPRMVEGGVDGGVFVIFTAQGQRDAAANARARDAASGPRASQLTS